MHSIIRALVLALALGASSLAGAKEGKPTENDIARATANVLDGAQFLRRPLDARLSRQFLDCYLRALDGAHLLFLQSDLDEFDRFRPMLAQLTVRKGETRPAHIIYRRYLKRLAQQVAFETDYARSAKFDFTGSDSWQADRRDAPPARDLTAAKVLWREEVRQDYLREKLAGAPEAEIAPLLARRYEQRLQTMQRLKTDDILEIYLDSLAHVYDPHSDYFGREELDDFKIEMDLSLVGLGATLETKDGFSVITDIVPGGPAARSGLLKPGDRIVAIAQDGNEPKDIVGLPPSRVVELLRGQKGSTVRLTIIPSGAGDSVRKTVSLVRDEIKLADKHAKAALIDLPQAKGPVLRVGVIDLRSFYGTGDALTGGAAADTAHLVIKLKQEGAAGIILDLRRNGGGSLEEAIWLAGLFVPSEPVVQTLGPAGEVQVDMSQEASALYDGPLVVLTSRLSASASEIVAGALQDYGRALIVGDSATFGKGTVQTVVPLKAFLHYHGLGAVKVTIAKFYRPSGKSTQLKGVTPDIVLPSEIDLSGLGESNLPHALPWDILPAAPYLEFDMVRPELAALRARSLARVAADQGFRLVAKEQAMAARQQNAKSLSLNEAERRREKAEADEISAEIGKVSLADAAHLPPTYDITLADIESPGLPPPRKAAGDDIVLRETENILADYIRSLRANSERSAVSMAR